jgi:hypothetical protein
LNYVLSNILLEKEGNVACNETVPLFQIESLLGFA